MDDLKITNILLELKRNRIDFLHNIGKEVDDGGVTDPYVEAITDVAFRLSSDICHELTERYTERIYNRKLYKCSGCDNRIYEYLGSDESNLKCADCQRKEDPTMDKYRYEFLKKYYSSPKGDKSRLNDD